MFCYLMKDRKGVYLDGRGSREYRGGVEGGETVTRMHCLIEFIFNNRGEQEKKRKKTI